MLFMVAGFAGRGARAELGELGLEVIVPLDTILGFMIRGGICCIGPMLGFVVLLRVGKGTFLTINEGLDARCNESFLGARTKASSAS